jgi:hypothetical protein
METISGMFNNLRRQNIYWKSADNTKHVLYFPPQLLLHFFAVTSS